MIRVMLADDQNLVRSGLSMLINSQPDLQVVEAIKAKIDRQKTGKRAQRGPVAGMHAGIQGADFDDLPLFGAHATLPVVMA